MLALFLGVPQPSMPGLFLPSAKWAPGDPKHTLKKEHPVYVPCLMPRPLQSIDGVKKYKLTKLCPFSFPPKLGNNSVLKGLNSGLNVLV